MLNQSSISAQSQEKAEEKAAQSQQQDDDKTTAVLNGYKYLSPGAKTSQIIQINNPEVQAELPLILDEFARIIDEARRQLLPNLYPTQKDQYKKSVASVNVSIADAARTTVCVMGDTFEAFSIV